MRRAILPVTDRASMRPSLFIFITRPAACFWVFMRRRRFIVWGGAWPDNSWRPSSVSLMIPCDTPLLSRPGRSRPCRGERASRISRLTGSGMASKTARVCQWGVEKLFMWLQ
jgi:hypothetical protein